MSTLRRRPSAPDMLAERARARARKKRIANQRPPPTLHTATMKGGTTGAAPKTEPKRNRALTDLARGEACLLKVPGICNGDRRTTVACHSNLGIHGKAKSRKADDQYSVWGCGACHFWLDQGPAPADVKELAFTLAHIDQVQAWRHIAGDPFGMSHKTPKQRKAAQWALDQLGATPLGDTNVR
jgi:hypothetical protein